MTRGRQRKCVSGGLGGIADVYSGWQASLRKETRSIEVAELSMQDLLDFVADLLG